MTRKYRIAADGTEQPVWASRKKLERLGREEGARAYWNKRDPTTFGNAIHDQAAWDEYRRLTGAEYGRRCT